MALQEGKINKIKEEREEQEKDPEKDLTNKTDWKCNPSEAHRALRGGDGIKLNGPGTSNKPRQYSH